jgi:hypothetical protein
LYESVKYFDIDFWGKEFLQEIKDIRHEKDEAELSVV